MKGLTVVSAFVDKRTGATIRPGDPLPKGLDAERVQSLVRARCLVARPKGAAAKTQRKVAKGAGNNRPT